MAQMINRGPGVVGWDADKKAPKGVVSPTAHRGGIAPIAQRAGVFTTGEHTEAALSTSNSSREVTLTPANVAITAPMGGWYLPWWSGLVRLTPEAAGSQARIDVLYVAQRDYELDGLETDSPALIDIKQGVASATPQRPSLSDGELGLWELKIPAGATTSSEFILTRLFDWTAPFGSSLGQVEDTGWLPMKSWTWGSGFGPAQMSFQGMSPLEYRVTEYGRRVIIDGGVRHTNTNTSEMAAFLVPTELRPKTHSVLTRQAVSARIDSTTGNVYIAGVGQSEFDYIHIEWLLDKVDEGI